MKNLKLYEEFLNEAATKFVWKRPNMGRGMSNIGHNNELRDWELFVNTKHVMTISNWGRIASALRPRGAAEGWIITVLGDKTRFHLKDTFKSADVEDAKKYCEEYYTMMQTLGDDAPQELKDQRAKMIFPSRPKPREGDFKKVLPMLRAGLGDRFKWYISTNKISPPRTHMTYDPDTFNETGTFSWVDSRNDPKQDIERLEDILGDEWKVTFTKSNGFGTIKLEKVPE